MGISQEDIRQKLTNSRAPKNLTLKISTWNVGQTTPSVDGWERDGGDAGMPGCITNEHSTSQLLLVFIFQWVLPENRGVT